MPKRVLELTHLEILNAKPRSKEYNLSHGKGLAVRVRPNGSKLWIFNYTHPATGKRTNVSFGKFPEVSLDEAQTKRDHYRTTLREGKDPQYVEQEKSRANREHYENTLHAIATEWLTLKKTEVSEDFAEDIWRSLELHVFPKIGNTPIKKLHPTNVKPVLAPLAKSEKLETLKRVCQRLNEIMTFALNSGAAETNPLAGIAKAFPKPKKVNLPTIKPDELPDLLSAIEKANIRHTTRYLILWQLHTMLRPSEAAGARWSEIDLENNVWRIPAERMKKKRPHNVPLTPQALALLEKLKPYSKKREHLFPADRNPRKPTNSQTANMALKRMGYHGKLVSHGLRSVASTALNESGLFDPDVIEAALAHVDKNETRRDYNRSDYLERRREVMNWWSDLIDKAALDN